MLQRWFSCEKLQCWFSCEKLQFWVSYEKLRRAVLAAASPSLLGPSLLQEGSEAEDMVSVTVLMKVIVMTTITTMTMITDDNMHGVLNPPSPR